MKFVIPSLGRVDILMQKSLPLLVNKYLIDQQSIYLFVIEAEYTAYCMVVHAVYPGVHIIVGPLGLHHMRNFIHGFFPENEELICMDDDISGLVLMTEDPQVLDKKKSERYPVVEITAEQFMACLTSAFRIMREQGINLWGIYPVKNGYFMKDLPELTYDLRFIVGCFWGCMNRPDIHISIEEKEDVERTILYYKRDNKVLRFNRIAPLTKYYKQSGGMQARGVDRIETSKQSCMYLIDKYPDYCKLYTGKKSGIWEIKLMPKRQ